MTYVCVDVLGGRILFLAYFWHFIFLLKLQLGQELEFINGIGANGNMCPYGVLTCPPVLLVNN